MGYPVRIVSIASLFFASLLVLPISASAQIRAMPAGKARPAFHSYHVRPVAPHSVAAPRMRIVTAAPARASAPARALSQHAGDEFGSTFAGASGQTLQQLLDPVPGLGFDYAHLAAINSDLAIKAVIDPETQWRLAVAERVLHDTGGFSTPGYYLLDGGAYVVPTESMPTPPREQKPPQSQPTIIVLKELPATQQPSTQVAPAAAPQPSGPLPDVSSFTLVLQDGKKIQAIAFTRVSDRIAYITADGVRHSIAASQLDTAATKRINEESGTPLQL